MADKALKKYGLEAAAKMLIGIGFLFVISAWIVGTYYYGATGESPLFIPPFIFTCVLVLLLLIIRYRYTLFEKYPYLMNLPSLFYHIEDKKGSNNRSTAFSMIFTVHALVIAFLGLESLALTINIGSSIQSKTTSPFLYIYLIIIAVLFASVLLQYRRIYVRFAK